MDDQTALVLLEELAGKLGISIRYAGVRDDVTGPGGLCKMEGKYILIIHSKATDGEKIRTMIEALRRFDLGQVFVKPALRALLEEHLRAGLST